MKNLILILLTGLTFNSAAQAGGVGNGGVAYVCRNPENNEITYARLLDLWEPETQSIPQTNKESSPAQLNRALKLIGDFFPHGKTDLSRIIQEDEARTLMSNKALTLTTDALPSYGPGRNKNCEFEQVALHGYDYELRKVVLKINKEIYNSPLFSNTDRAALKLHEALYSVARKYWDVRDSRFVRSVIATMFSTDYSDFRKIDPGLRYAIAQLFVYKHCQKIAFDSTHYITSIDNTKQSECNATILPLMNELSGHTIIYELYLPAVSKSQKKKIELSHAMFHSYSFYETNKGKEENARLFYNQLSYDLSPSKASDTFGGGSFRFALNSDISIESSIKSLWHESDENYISEYPLPNQTFMKISPSYKGVFDPKDSFQSAAFVKEFEFKLDKPVHLYPVLLSRLEDGHRPGDEYFPHAKAEGIDFDYEKFINP